MSASKFLQVLEQSGMLDKSILLDLRKQVADSKYKVSAESIAKILVDKGHLTKFQATRFVGQATDDVEEPPPKKSPPKKAPEPPPGPAVEEDDLGLAPEDAAELGIAPTGSKSSAPSPQKPGRGKQADEEDVILLEAAGGSAEPSEGLMPVEDAGEGLTPVGPVTPLLTPVPAASSPHVPELQPAGDLLGAAGGLDPFAQVLAGPIQPILPPTPRSGLPRWDTMLIWGGSLALALLLLFGGVLWYSLSKTPPLEMFEAAMKDYRAESYSQAVAKFENFLEQYPKDEKASEAHVRVALAKIRLAVGNPEAGLKTAQELIPTITNEPAFQMAREELAGILPAIPEGFVKLAKTTQDTAKAAALLGQAEAGMKMVLDPANIPTSIRLRIDPDIQRIQEDMALVQRNIDQDKELTQALTDIDAAVTANDTVKAFQIYQTLVKKYPGLDANERLNAAVVQVSQRERGLVKQVAQTIEPNTTEAVTAPPRATVLARRTGDGAPNAQGYSVSVLAGGSVYGFEVGTGRVLWRRFVGQGTRAHPVRLSDQPETDVLLVDGSRQEILRCRGTDGTLVWRTALGEAFAAPVLAGRNVYVSTSSGRLLEIDAASGRSARHVTVPQKLLAGPAVAPNRPRAFQVGEHSNVYVISTDTLECKDVFYLGHKPGAVNLPPLVLLNYAFVVENAGSDYALLHTLTIRSEGEGPALKTSQPPIRLAGNVRVPLMPYGRRLLVTTDRGEIRVLDVDVASTAEPVKDAAKLPPLYTEPTVGYPLADANSLWIADNRLTNYRVQVTTKEISRNPNIANVGDTFVAPLQLFQNTLVSVRRVKDSAGITVAAAQVDNPRKPLWETSVNVPISYVSVDPQSRQVTALTAAGTVYPVTPGQPSSTCIDQPASSIAGPVAAAFTEAVELGGGRIALCNTADSQHFVSFTPGPNGGQVNLVEWKGLAGKLACRPVAFQQSLMALSDTGEIRLFDPANGASTIMPFQPKVAPGEVVQWRQPAMTAPDAREFLVADNRRILYRVGLKDQPQPFLAELANSPMEVELVSGLAIAGQTVYAVARAETTDAVVAIGLGDLKVAQQWDLKGGRVTWGPTRVGEVVLLAVDGKFLRCFGADQKERWKQPAVAYGQPVGPPLQIDQDFVFASVDGQLWRVAGSSGKTSASTPVGEPLLAGPIASGNDLVLAGSEGVLLMAPVPVGP